MPRVLIGDITRLRQILANLVGNAVKFTDAGHVVLSVRALTTDSDNCELFFSVKDTGIGIHVDQMARLFTTFSQVDGSTTRRYRFRSRPQQEIVRANGRSDAR